MSATITYDGKTTENVRSYIIGDSFYVPYSSCSMITSCEPVLLFDEGEDPAEPGSSTSNDLGFTVAMAVIFIAGLGFAIFYIYKFR